ADVLVATVVDVAVLERAGHRRWHARDLDAGQRGREVEVVGGTGDQADLFAEAARHARSVGRAPNRVAARDDVPGDVTDDDERGRPGRHRLVLRRDDDLAVVALADAARRDVRVVGQRQVDDAPLAGRHRLERDRLAGLLDAGGDAAGQAAERLLAAG